MQHQIRRYYSRKLQYNLGCFYSKLSCLETIWDISYVYQTYRFYVRFTSQGV